MKKCPNFTWFLPEKNIKIPEFLRYSPKIKQKFHNFTWFCPKNARILHNNYPKNIFPEFWGARSPTSMPPISYAYGSGDWVTAGKRIKADRPASSAMPLVVELVACLVSCLSSFDYFQHRFLPCDALRCTVFVIVILSVCLSVCHTRGLCPHGSTYDHDFFTIW